MLKTHSTYCFIVSIFLLIGLGLLHTVTGQISPVATPVSIATTSLSLFLILRAFAAGCTALTGVEAISDGVLVFKPPEWKNSRLTLRSLGIILGITIKNFRNFIQNSRA
ncbi:MAG TPA: hypothetical protein IGS17_03350 [Oscillatoriales cyanobacterium M59_W2019_021]|nr:hypothetical protein [Oscillatoriales cyanobacterium M4454_W2019_049]HIK49949.1 hypothetical protein [Oscillatoriales cyanobacterium M59_W2019_021]